MLENLQVQQPFESQTYTIAEIDGHLAYIVNLMAAGCTEDSRKLYIKYANRWLDKRLKLMA